MDDEPENPRCRLVVKMICLHGMIEYRHDMASSSPDEHLTGVTKTYRLTYEPVEVMRALFDRQRATNSWAISAKLLREYSEYFSPKTEQLDIYPEEGRCTFLSFTEKIMHGKGRTNAHMTICLSNKCHSGPETTSPDFRLDRDKGL